ncbi:hypothetical protein ACE6H2_013280 [Prunus campanulata]
MDQQNPDQRLKPALQTENQQQQQQNQQPQKCPRCESLNTKFCYYNNYSLSQPRYFCKTCRRYWTQGGTLRNVPVGGGCRKGKRPKTNSSSSSSPSLQPQAQAQAQAPQQDQQTVKNLSTTSPSSNPGAIESTGNLASHHQYYPGGTGYLSSYAAIQSLNQSQPFNVGGHDQLGGGASSNMSLLQGFNVSAPFGQFYQAGNTKSSMVDQTALYPSDQEGLLIQPTRPSAASDHDWPHQSFNINRSSANASSAASESALWATTTSGNMNTTTTTSAGPSLNPNQWPDLPGSYGPPN